MTTSDSLSALRQTIKAHDSIKFLNGSDPCGSLVAATHIKLEDAIFSKSTPTRFRKPGTDSTDWKVQPDGFYTIEAIVLAWLLKELPVAEYMKQAREAGLAVGFVSVTERKGVVDWLEGKISTHERIVGGGELCILHNERIFFDPVLLPL
jgi:parafibromin